MRSSTLEHWQHAPLLSAAEEQALARRVHQPGQEEPGAARDDGLAARNKLVECNIRLIARIAKGYVGRFQLDDLMQDGAVGLLHAAESFEPGRTRFSTYAWGLVHQAMVRGMRRDMTIQVTATALAGIRREDRGEELSPIHARLASFGRVAMSAIAIGRGGYNARNRPSADSSTRDGIGAIPAPEPTLAVAQEELDKLARKRRRLSAAEQVVLHGRFEEGLKLSEVGARLGVTKERVRQVEAAGLRRLRTLMGYD